MADRAMPTMGPAIVKHVIGAGYEIHVPIPPLDWRGATEIAGALDTMPVCVAPWSRFTPPGYDEMEQANMDLIAAAFNSATAAHALGFDPIAAVQALPKLLALVLDVASGHYDDMPARIGAQADAVIAASQVGSPSNG